MPVIRIVDDYHERDSLVTPQLVIETIERNRDRIRTVSNMILTLSGLLLTILVAVVPFAHDKIASALHWKQVTIGIIYGLAVCSLLITAHQSIYASLLRTTYSVTRTLRFVDSLLRLYYAELRHLNVAFVFMATGILLVVVCQIVFFV